MIKYLFVRIFRNEGVKWKKQWKQIREIMKERVPEKDRKRWLSISMVWIAIGIDLSGMFMGVALSQGMAFWTAIYAVIIGSVILGILAIGATYIGAKAGLSTGMISRISFGKKGASLMGQSWGFLLWAGLVCRLGSLLKILARRLIS
ncbi:cytosine permease [Enterococcus avium]